MECGMVGLPGVGKTTLLNALTGSRAAPSAALKPNVGVAKIPDPRLGLIASYIPTKKIVSATIQFVDIPGVPASSRPDAAKLNAFLAHVRQVDALVHVVKCFDDGSGAPDPTGDIDKMDTELVIADLQVAESALDKASRAARAGDADSKARAALLEKVLAILNEGKPIRSSSNWSDPEKAMLKSYGLVTAKPVLYVANVGEDQISVESSQVDVVRKHAQGTGGRSVVVCAKLEAELAELDEKDRDEMLGSMGLSEPAIGPLARAANSLLGLASFYTAGEKEVRSWPVRLGATAPQAAGSVHSDIERGFIRAECYNVDDLVKYKSEKAIREAGRLRSEGKNYQLRDGDVVHFLFNV
ncbi:MAG: redox-regulated ATPase YchF [Phycisphaerales bacterium]|nr:redox-regulated ATPase YchF [Phycisphaerales bacterium]